jgi:cytochrome c oxidase subunit IV
MTGANHTTIWLWLLALLAAGLLVSLAPVGRPIIIALILATALAKAFLVARHMHLKQESLLIHAIIAAPLLLVVCLVLALVPDLVWSR